MNLSSDVSPRGSPMKAWWGLESPLPRWLTFTLASGAGCPGCQFLQAWASPQGCLGVCTALCWQPAKHKSWGHFPQGFEKRQKLQRHQQLASEGTRGHSCSTDSVTQVSPLLGRGLRTWIPGGKDHWWPMLGAAIKAANTMGHHCPLYEPPTLFHYLWRHKRGPWNEFGE